jgi:predicted dehydrogenase
MTVRWGMLSTASIGRVVAGAIRGSTEAEFVAVAGRDPRRAAAYAAALGVPRSFGSYDALLADDGVDGLHPVADRHAHGVDDPCAAGGQARAV